MMLQILQLSLRNFGFFGDLDHPGDAVSVFTEQGK